LNANWASAALERVELLLRIEQAFGTRLDDRVLAEAETGCRPDFPRSGAVNGLSAVATNARQCRTRAPAIPSSGIADGSPPRNDSRRVAPSRPGRRLTKNAPDFFRKTKEKAQGLTFGELFFRSPERVARSWRSAGSGVAIS